jgi:hypothetical protein
MKCTPVERSSGWNLCHNATYLSGSAICKRLELPELNEPAPYVVEEDTLERWVAWTLPAQLDVPAQRAREQARVPDAGLTQSSYGRLL